MDMKMTNSSTENLMNDLIKEIICDKYNDISFSVVEKLIAISKENRDRAKALKVMRKYMVEYFNNSEQCSE